MWDKCQHPIMIITSVSLIHSEHHNQYTTFPMNIFNGSIIYSQILRRTWNHMVHRGSSFHSLDNRGTHSAAQYMNVWWVNKQQYMFTRPILDAVQLLCAWYVMWLIRVEKFQRPVWIINLRKLTPRQNTVTVQRMRNICYILHVTWCMRWQA